MSDSDKQALLDGTATIQTEIEVINEGGTNTVLTEENSVIDWNHEDFRQVKEEGFIGQFVARQLTGNLKNLSDNFKITDKELILRLGVRTNNNTNWYSLGNFIVTKVSDDEVKDKTSFEALDYTKKFNKAYEDTITYPCTALQLAQNVCSQCGVYLGNNDFRNYDYVIEGNVFTNNESCRDVMKAIGKLSFSWVRVDWDNKVYIDFDPSPFRNLFDGELESGDLNSSNGNNETNNNRVRTTNFIEVKSSTKYLISTNVSIGRIIQYDANKNFIRYNAGSDNPLTTTSTTKYVRFSLLTTDTTTNVLYNQQPSEYETFGNNKYYNLKTQKEVFGPVDKVVIGYSAIDGERTFIGDENGSCEITVYDNPLVFNQTQRASVISAANDLLGMTYTPLNTLTVGHPWLKGNEKVRVTDMENVSHDTIPLDRTIQYFGHIKTLINSSTQTKTNDTLAYKPELEKQYARTEISVDKINKKIEQVIVDQSDTNTRLNQTISTLDGTIQRVSNTENTVQDITTTTQSKSGGNELYIEDALARDVINYSVDGASEQNGTPTPSSPQEVKTIPSIINLFDKDNVTRGYRLTQDGKGTPDTNYYVSPWIKIEPNTTYTKNSPTADAYHRMCFYTSADTNTFISRNENNTATSPSNAQYMRICGLQTELDTTMIEEGTVAHEYVPYGYYTRVKVTGKNLFNDNVPITSNGIVSTYNDDGSISYSGQASSNWADLTARTFCMIPAGTTLTFSIDSAKNVGVILYFDKSNTDRMIIPIGSTSVTLTTTVAHTQAKINIDSMTSGTSYSGKIYPQLEEGTTATSYEQYKENEVLIDMSKENLFDKDDANILTSYISYSGVLTSSDGVDKTIYIPCKPNTTYTISKMLQQPTSTNRFRLGTSSEIPTNGITLNNFINKPGGTTDTLQTITTGNNANYLCVFIYTSSSATTTLDEMLNSLQIFEGTSPTPYYELCSNKDKTIKDRLLVDTNGNCSITKYIGKKVLNGSENDWSKYSYTFTLNNAFIGKPSSMCSHFTDAGETWVSSNEQYRGKYTTTNAANQFKCMPLTDLSLNDFKTWLSNNNVTLQYVLATPETIHLSNTQIPLYEGINHITFVDDLETSTSVTYYRQTPLSSTYATQQQLNDVSTEKSQEIRTTRNEVIEEINSQYLKISAFNETLNDGVPIVRTETGYTFDIDGLKIEKSDNDVKSQLDNDGLSVKYKGTDILTARSAGVNTVNMTVNKFYIQRPIRMEKTKSISDGSSVGLGFYYIGE